MQGIIWLQIKLTRDLMNILKQFVNKNSVNTIKNLIIS